jgi:hypothetical protein
MFLVLPTNGVVELRQASEYMETEVDVLDLLTSKLWKNERLRPREVGGF